VLVAIVLMGLSDRSERKDTAKNYSFGAEFNQSLQLNRMRIRFSRILRS